MTGTATTRAPTPEPPTLPPHPSITAWAAGREARAAAFAELTSGQKITFQEGLNGVRGMAVIAVVMFHLGYHEIVGGAQLAMSLFFTQSGFLIALLILHEYDHTGRFRLGPFWAARLRRVLPPAWMTLAGAGIIRVLTDAYGAPNRGDVLTAFVHVSNWYLWATDAIVDAIATGRSSELNHFWSLSVEEQFYVFIAFFSVFAVAATRRPLIVVRWTALTLAAISFALPFVFGWDEERVFYGTDTRAGELLVGVAVATVLISRPVRERMLAASWVWATCAAGALVAAWVLFYYATPARDLLPRGLLPVATGLWLLIVIGAMLPDGPVAWLMRTRLLLWLGKLSYGIYAFHFPILHLVRHLLGDVHPFVVTAVASAATLTVAVVSYRAIEMPIRRRQIVGRPLAIGAAVLVAIIAVTTIV